MKATVPNKAIVGHGRLSLSRSADKDGELETLKAVDGVSEKEKIMHRIEQSLTTVWNRKKWEDELNSTRD